MSVCASVLLPGLFAVMQATPPQAPPAPNPDIHYQDTLSNSFPEKFPMQFVRFRFA